jgi:hypothetical protein
MEASMATYRNNGDDTGINEIFILVDPEDVDVIEALPYREPDAFTWDELILSKEVMEKALNKIPVISDFKDIDPYGLGLPFFAQHTYEDNENSITW